MATFFEFYAEGQFRISVNVDHVTSLVQPDDGEATLMYWNGEDKRQEVILSEQDAERFRDEIVGKGKAPRESRIAAQDKWGSSHKDPLEARF